MALGADRGRILSWTVARSLPLALLGAARGFAFALVASRLLVALLLFVALAASYLPARRALGVSPVTALRVE